jgi:hypothetical protein
MALDNCQEAWHTGTKIGMKETAMTVRQNTNTLLELIEDGVLNKDMVIRACLMWMSDREVGEMAEQNELFPTYDEE